MSLARSSPTARCALLAAIGIGLVAAILGHCPSATSQAAPPTARPAGAKPRDVNAGTKSAQRLKTPPVQENFSIVIFGDRTGGPRSGLKVLREAVFMANRLAPDFVMTVGDLINGYNRAKEWRAEMKRFKKIMGRLRSPWYPVVGNHDVYGPRNAPGGRLTEYKEHFGPLYYSFDYRFAHVICLFSDEALSFRNPAKNQNMSETQLAWLKRDLAETKSDIIMCFLHHPRWTKQYEGCNWPEVHRVLKHDGRVKAVFAGHIHEYRDDGVRDGIHYFTLATTGGHLTGFEALSFHHLNHVRVWRDRFEMAVLPVGNLRSPDMVLGHERDEIRRAHNSGWTSVNGRVQIAADQATKNEVSVTITNPTSRPVRIDARIEADKPYTVDPRRVKSTLPPGERMTVQVRVTTPPFDWKQPKLHVKATLFYKLRSGVEQPIRRRVDFPIDLTGVGIPAARVPNRALELDGKRAIRVPIPALEGAFTLECWVKGAKPEGRTHLLARTQSSNFGIHWHPRPGGSLYVGKRGKDGERGRGYVSANAADFQHWDRWSHVALSFDGKALRFFVNGELVEEVAGREPSYDARPFFIGADPDGSGKPTSFFTGMIDEVRLSTVARYTESFTPARRLKTDDRTLCLFHFDHSKPGFILDASGRGNHGWPTKPIRLTEVTTPR